jgi:hypothetical protein
MSDGHRVTEDVADETDEMDGGGFERPAAASMTP